MTQPAQPTTSIRNRSSGAIRDEAKFRARLKEICRTLTYGRRVMTEEQHAITEAGLQAIDEGGQ